MKALGIVSKSGSKKRPGELKRVWQQNYQLWLIILIPFAWLILFKYWPMYGAQIAFRSYRAIDGVWGSKWVGFANFTKLFRNYMFPRIIKNTLIVSFYQLLVSFPFPIILALALHNSLHSKFKKSVQMITYMPHFISTVVLVGMIMQFANPHVGLINKLIVALGGTAQDFMASRTGFYHMYVWSNVWQNCGWGTIIYLAALSSVNMDLHEAAMIDGAGRFKRMLYIDIPCIIPTAIVLLIMDAGRIMAIGFEKAFLMQNLMNISSSEIISTYAYKVGLAQAAADFSYSTTISLFNSIVNMILIMIVNSIAAKWGETSLW
ncbi:sugar ABC transporter permease [Spirochaetia bacterium]|nr:sugar ABC transporter permease [Spirochaetia bacterium]